MMARYMFAIDVDRCLGCQSCIVGCKLQNKVPLGSYRNTVCTVGPFGDYPHMQMYFLPIMCQHCEEPACVNVCPTEACYLDKKTGLIQIDSAQCVGCKCCMMSCPYHAIDFHQQLRIADKCSACLSESGDMNPVCVKNCPGSAIYFGDVEDSESAISKFMRDVDDKHMYHLFDKGTKPRTCYVLRKGIWFDVGLENGWLRRE